MFELISTYPVKNSLIDRIKDEGCVRIQLRVVSIYFHRFRQRYSPFFPFEKATRKILLFVHLSMCACWQIINYDILIVVIKIIAMGSFVTLHEAFNKIVERAP